MKTEIFKQMRTQMDASDALTQRTIYQVQQQTKPRIRLAKRCYKVIAVAAVMLALLGCTFLVSLTLPANVGDIDVAPAYDSTGAQEISPDGYLVWIVTESDDSDLSVGTKVVVDESTGAFAVYAPPVSTAENTEVNTVVVTENDASDTVSVQYSYPIHEYQSYEIVLYDNRDVWANRYYATLGTELYAIATGTVVSTDYNGVGTGYGSCVIIDNEDGTTISYTHCNEILVAIGETVTAGQVVATVGSSGYCSEPMCDIIFNDGEQTIDLQTCFNTQE